MLITRCGTPTGTCSLRSREPFKSFIVDSIPARTLRTGARRCREARQAHRRPDGTRKSNAPKSTPTHGSRLHTRSAHSGRSRARSLACASPSNAPRTSADGPGACRGACSADRRSPARGDPPDRGSRPRYQSWGSRCERSSFVIHCIHACVTTLTHSEQMPRCTPRTITSIHGHACWRRQKSHPMLTPASTRTPRRRTFPPSATCRSSIRSGDT